MDDTQGSEKPLERPLEPQKQALQTDKTDLNRQGVQKLCKRPHTGYTTSSKTINKIKRLKALNEPNTQIAIKCGVARGTVQSIVNNPQIKESIETIKSRLADKCAVLAETSIDAIGPNDINNASVVQKATVFGIAVDKYNDLTDSNSGEIGDSHILSGLKGSDILDFINSGSTVKIGISIEPRNNTVTQAEKVETNAPNSENK